MDLDLPDLDMKQPDELDADATLEEIEEDIAIQEENDDPFKRVQQPTKELLDKMATEQVPIEPEKPKRKKRELSQKQKDHLANCRELAKAKREAKKKAKEEALEKVAEEHKAKSYKPAKHKAKVEKEYSEAKSVAKATYKARTIKVKDEVEIKPEDEDNTPDDFLPTQKAKRAEKVKKDTETEQMAFINFMTNMERYKQLKTGYKEAKERKEKTAPAPSAPSTPKQEVKPVQPINLQVKQPINDNPFSGFFG
jgi:hypothetical protein